MKYHYQQGVVEKDKKGHKKAWLAFFVVIALVGYSGFIFATLALNGYPLESIDTTAKLVKNSKPGSLGNHLFIPAINLTESFGNSLSLSGKPEGGKIVVRGTQLAPGITSDSLRASSPFFNIDKLKSGDEIFLDTTGTRYVYRITDSSKSDDGKLVLQSKSKTLVAEAVGTIAWNGGKAQLQPL